MRGFSTLIFAGAFKDVLKAHVRVIILNGYFPIKLIPTRPDAFLTLLKVLYCLLWLNSMFFPQGKFDEKEDCGGYHGSKRI